jgi:hypothetical protein
MYPIVLGLCMTVAGYITLDVCARNPTEADLRKIAEITIRSDVLAELDEARKDGFVPLDISESAVYQYLSRAVLDYEPITEVFPPMEASTLPLLFTGALLAVFRPRQANLHHSERPGGEAPAFPRKRPTQLREAGGSGGCPRTSIIIVPCPSARSRWRPGSR